MWSTIFPELMSITVFVLTLLCLRAGSSPHYLQKYPILSLNTTDLRTNYRNTTNGGGLPIHDVYELFMTTTCAGYWGKNSSPPLGDVTCSGVSIYSKFFPTTLIQADLTLHRSPVNTTTLSFPPGIQNAFNERFNLQLHVALVFYIIALVWVGLVILWGMAVFWVGALGVGAVVGTSAATTALLIASAIVTAVQSEAVAVINDQGATIGVTGITGKGFLALTWSAFAINAASSLVWCLGGAVSGAVRGL